MFVETEKSEVVTKVLEIPIRELRYLLKETFDLDLPDELSFAYHVDDNLYKPSRTLDASLAQQSKMKLVISWKENKEEKFSDLILSKSVTEEVLRLHETVKDRFPTPQDLVQAALETAVAESEKIVSTNTNQKGKSKNAKRS